MVSNEPHRNSAESGPAEPSPGKQPGPLAGYEAPTLQRLGALEGLTQGGNIGIDDAVGAAGATGSV